MTETTAELKEALARARRDLEASQTRFRNVIENNADGILVVGMDGIIRFANPAAAALFGRPAQTLGGEDFGFPVVFEEQTEIGLIRRPGETITVEMRVTESEWEGEPCYLASLRDVTERKASERELQRIAHLNQLLLDTLPHPAMLIQQDRRILAANRAAREAGAEVGGYCWQDFGHAEYIPADVRACLKANDGALPADCTETVHCTFCLADRALASGEPANLPELEAFDRVWDTWWVPIDDTIYLHYAIDITERRQMERAVRESEARLDSMLQTMVDGVVFVNPEGEITYANAAAERILEVYRDGILGRYYHERNWQQIDEHGDPYPADRLPLTLALREHRAVESVEHGIVAPNGDRKWLSVNAAPLMDGEGQLYGAVASFRDVTQQKRMEEALRDSEQRYRTLFDHAGDAIFVHDLDGQFLDVNRVACERLGYTREALLEMTPMDIAASEDADQVRGHIEAIQRAEHIVFEATHVRRDGTRIPVEINSRYIEYEGRPAVLNLARDITGRREAEEAIGRYADELERSNEELEHFAYIVSHDLREPLRMVSSYLALLKRRYAGDLDAKADKFIDYAVDGADRMQEMIQALLDLSRVETQGRDFAPTDTGAIVARTLKALGRVIHETEAEINHGPLPTVMADEAQLTQVFQNLIANALKFHREGVLPRVHIAAREGERGGEGEGEWVFSVTDNGIGLDPAQADRLFQVFQRLHTREEYEGMGIGLALCKRIIERHGGRIWVESRPGEGSTLVFTLPIRKEAL
jgi:PAS domain S-box-containing protein